VVAVTFSVFVDDARDQSFLLLLLKVLRDLVLSPLLPYTTLFRSGVGPAARDDVADVIGARGQAGEAVTAVGGRGRPGLAGLLGGVVVGVDEHGYGALAGFPGRGAVTVGVVVDGGRDRSVTLLLQE